MVVTKKKKLIVTENNEYMTNIFRKSSTPLSNLVKLVCIQVVQFTLIRPFTHQQSHSRSSNLFLRSISFSQQHEIENLPHTTMRYFYLPSKCYTQLLTILRSFYPQRSFIEHHPHENSPHTFVSSFSFVFPSCADFSIIDRSSNSPIKEFLTNQRICHNKITHIQHNSSLHPYFIVKGCKQQLTYLVNLLNFSDMSRTLYHPFPKFQTVFDVAKTKPNIGFFCSAPTI